MHIIRCIINAQIISKINFKTKIDVTLHFAVSIKHIFLVGKRFYLDKLNFC